jgi:hypothetical protein
MEMSPFFRSCIRYAVEGSFDGLSVLPMAEGLVHPSSPRRDWRMLMVAMAAVSDRKMC